VSATVTEPGSTATRRSGGSGPPGLALALPKAASLTNALLAPVGRGVTADDVERARRTVVEARSSAKGGGGGLRLELDSFRFDRARSNVSEPWPQDEPFVPTPARCRRAVGLDAIRRCLGRGRPSPSQAVAAVLADAVDDVAGAGGSSPWWAAWYAGSGRGTRSVVHAGAITWATTLWTSVQWGRLVRVDVSGGRVQWVSSPGPTATVLRARFELRTWVGDGLVALMLGGGDVPSDWRPTLGFPALVAALGYDERVVPRRVVAWWPAAGHVRIAEVDGALLGETADAVASVLRARISSAPSPR
jgi:hypothetical protein